MVFSSISFLFIFLPAFLLVYYLVNAKFKNYVLLAASIIFYAWGAPKFVFLLLGSLIANFYIVKRISTTKSGKKTFLILSVILNVGMLAYFKYANFFIDNVNFILQSLHLNPIHWTRILLPIGISFFTFQSLTYTIDVYRKVHQPLQKITDYLLYILMFPQLIAGPIVRFNTVADDIIDRRHNETVDNRLLGIYRFVIGLSKKVFIANILGEQVDKIYAMPLGEIDSSLAWIALIAYSFQIYYDFSGYSDMAIGLGKMIGFKFPENFNSPYISRNISEFWRRWHMTLGAFMKDYLYIPLGGNKVKTKRRLYFNLATVFVLSGLWHGASWNFVVWGAWHGLFLILDRVFLLKLLDRMGKIPSIIFTYLVVLIGWQFFRIESFHLSWFYLKKLFSFQFITPLATFQHDFWFFMVLAVVFAFITVFKFGLKIEKITLYTNYKASMHVVVFILSCVMLFVCASFITASGFNPFIYFRF